MKHIKYLLFTILLLSNYPGFGQWTEISNIGDRFIQTFNFLDDDLGYALMNKENSNDPKIMKTIDGGANWTELNLPVPTGEFQDIYFYTEGEGTVVIRDLNDDMVPTKIFQTTDDGVNWEDISPDSTARGVGVGQCQFLDQNIGFLVTDRFFYKTIDGGENWTEKEFDDYLLSIHFLDADHGVMGTWNGRFSYKGSMLTTSDGGMTWAENLIDDNYTSIMEVQQITSEVAFAAPVFSWAAIQAGQFYKTTDGGANWNVIDIPMPGNDCTLRQIDFKDELNGVICVGNVTLTNIYRTTDGGQTWVAEGAISSTNYADLQLTPNDGYIGGKTGSFYKRSGTTSTRAVPIRVDLSIFPSPVKSGQMISWNSNEDFTHLLIIDPTGRTIHQQSLQQNQATLPQLAAGLYFVQLSNKKVFTTTKLIVE